MGNGAQPIRIELTRDSIESVHLVDAVICEGNGVRDVFGRADAPVIPRSAIKPIQTIPLVRSGAADAFAVTEVELALAGASHSGEPDHVSAVAAWLERIGLGVDALECGDDRPIHESSADQLLGEHIPFGAIHNCCSGKHAGFLTICRHLGYDPEGYIDRAHPVQSLVTEAIEEFTETDLSSASSGLDGCGIPTFSLPADALARAMVNLVRPDCLGSTTAAAAGRVSSAYSRHPWWISGTQRTEVVLGSIASEPIVLKGGAEGVFMGALPERGIGLALKARDGAHRAATTAIGAVLEYLGVVAEGTARVPVTNKAGTVVGEMRGVLP